MSAANSASTQLRDEGIALLRGVFAADSLAVLKEAAIRCFEKIEAGNALPEHYRYNRFSNSLLLTALQDFGCGTNELTAPLLAPRLKSLFSEAMGSAWICNMERSWLRKKLAQPSNHHPQGWHQDGALGVHFPDQTGPPIPMTQLLTCWIPFDPCGVDSPGLEFVRGHQQTLLHFSELHDSNVRQQFRSEEFWVPELKFGDGLIFLNSVLHRTCTHPEMRRDRLSVEYRIFPFSLPC